MADTSNPRSPAGRDKPAGGRIRNGYSVPPWRPEPTAYGVSRIGVPRGLGTAGPPVGLPGQTRSVIAAEGHLAASGRAHCRAVMPHVLQPVQVIAWRAAASKGSAAHLAAGLASRRAIASLRKQAGPRRGGRDRSCRGQPAVTAYRKHWGARVRTCTVATPVSESRRPMTGSRSAWSVITVLWS